MMIKNKFSLFLATFLIIGFFFLALPEKGFSGITTLPGGPPCCEVRFDFGNLCEGGDEAAKTCEAEGLCDAADCVFFDNRICVPDNESGELGSCVEPQTISAVPTLSQWGLIAIAVVLGIIGFIVIRRRKVSA